ncbi:hypothetical protein [Acaryochloris sp. CCMEE 5410]|uniref:hypothetical protein n=1 Tax=Acaryochloris sp. CCMEE 5410 TaxID=310037 RepID=UPI000248523A|nr:hypothetical protein [Acaryochloris sp. CCMEE 5410]KAI9130182.1 hypothetical protein ON05_031645 [Acaryochloris sp. CCMEE 5410]
MLTSLLAEALAITFDNLNMTASIFECAEEAAEDLSPVARQKLGLVHAGLALAIQGMECDELQQLIQRSELYCDF